MKFEDFKVIYEQMIDVFQRDKELTHIEVVFHIQPVKTEKKLAKINIKTFHDEHKK
jgi:hypothetical protein